MQRIVLVLACLASVGLGRRVAFNPSAPGARIPITSPSIATSPLRQQTPVMGKGALLNLFANKATSDAVPAHFEKQHILRRLVTSASVKRTAKLVARATGMMAAVLLLMQASAFAMPAGAKLPLAFSPAGVWASYESALGTNPLLVKSLTSFVGWTLGDVLCQTGVEKCKLKDLDVARTGRQALFGLAWHGPSSHYFYGFLDDLFPGASMDKVAIKAIIVSELWYPIFATIYFIYLNVMQGKTMMADLKAKMQQNRLTGAEASWGFGLPSNLVNFWLIPGDQRVLYINVLQVLDMLRINVLQVLYNIFLSFLGNKKVEEAPAPAPAAA